MPRALRWSTLQATARGASRSLISQRSLGLISGRPPRRRFAGRAFDAGGCPFAALAMRQAAQAHVTLEGLRLDGRERSRKTHRFIERTQNFPHLAAAVLREAPAGTVLDCELFMASAMIETTAVVNAGPGRSIIMQQEQQLERLLIQRTGLLTNGGFWVLAELGVVLNSGVVI